MLRSKGAPIVKVHCRPSIFGTEDGAQPIYDGAAEQADGFSSGP